MLEPHFPPSGFRQARAHQDEVVRIVSCPRLMCVVFLPVYCLIAAVLLALFHSPSVNACCGVAFSVLLMLALVVLGTDSKAATTTIALLLGMVLVLVLVVVTLAWGDVATPTLTALYLAFVFSSGPKFYLTMFLVTGIPITLSWLETLATVIEVRPNVVVVRRRFFGFGATELSRFDTDGLRISFMRHDVFEYMILGVGRLELWPATEKKSFVIEHFPARLIPRINHVLEATETRIAVDE